ncbi:AlpA family phage regulatory protein [uncultured Roseibium sp.]|uniref:helix-turn-helix transcriptional regulator n=1 Tax=uncultured Roseibium sp. TaxID=1936171 RepID=UPI002636CB77|nr:AlpA family phage regulatory protein [uncultured Roseibium sp.]
MTTAPDMLTKRELEALSSDTAVMDLKQVMKETTLAENTVYLLMREGKFPPNFKLVGKKVAWLRSEVEAWISWRIKEAKGNTRWQPPAADNDPEGAS